MLSVGPWKVDGDGKITDGRNRFRVCEIAWVEPRFKEWDGNGSLVDYVKAPT